MEIQDEQAWRPVTRFDRGDAMKRAGFALVLLLAFFVGRNLPIGGAHAQEPGDQKKLLSVIRPVTNGGSTTYFVVSEENGSVYKITTGLATPTLAFNQVRDDQGGRLGAPWGIQRIAVSTDAKVP